MRIEQGARSGMTELEFLERQIKDFKVSVKRMEMLKGEAYYDNNHDILQRKRTVIGEDGQLKEVENLPNNKQIDNQYAKLVDQKVNYLLGKPFTVESDNEVYAELLKGIFNMRFHRLLKNTGENSLNCGIGWIHPYYDDMEQLQFRKFESYEILPLWKDAEHTILDMAIRIYTVEGYEGKQEVTIEKVEVYTTKGVFRYVYKDNKLIPDVEQPSSAYVIETDADGNTTGLNWTKVPLVAFKYNNKEIPLIRRVKSLQDGINIMLSDFENNMQEDPRNTILILQNYDGENLGEFRRNLATYGAVKVKTVDGSAGGVTTLEIKVNSENYKVILDLFKKALVENGRGYDAKDDRMGGNPNQMNIQSMYSDIDLDANGMETEFQASFEELLWFINVHFVNTGKGDFEGERVKIIFNRDILINESESITNAKNSMGVISNETIVAQHPWVDDVSEEMKRVDAEAKKAAADGLDQVIPKTGDVSVK